MPSERAVLFDFSGTLFWIESAHDAVCAALGAQYASWAPRLAELSAINGGAGPVELPEHLADAWGRRDLSAEQHRAAYSGLARHAGLSAAQAHALYERGVRPEAWSPFADTVQVLRGLHQARVPIAVVSNIGWDPRPVFERHGTAGYVDVLVLSDERGVMKPDPEIFRQACAELGVAPQYCLMVGDNPDADGAATQLGIGFALVDPDPATRAPDGLLRAVGLPA